MASALPVAATRVGGVPDLLRGVNDPCGLRAPPGDAPALAGALALLLEDAETAERMGRAGRARVERDFSLSAMIAAHEELFLRLSGETAG
jgi:glycosyltransferase involved in cell wall biosynthesis